MADPQSTGPPSNSSVLPWSLPFAPPPTLPPPPLHGHQQHLMVSPPFSPFPPGNPGFVHGFPSPLQHPQQHHYNYNVGPRPFPPFHGLAPNQGSFRSPPPLAPPPRAPPPQMISGMVSTFQSPRGGGASELLSGNVAQSEQYNGTPSPGIANSDNLGFSKEQDVEINVIEKALLKSQKENGVDITALLSQIRAVVDQAEEAVQKVGELVLLEPSMSESRLVTCPYNPTHRVSPENFFKHYLCCPSNPKPQIADPEKLISSLQYPHSQQHDDEEDSGPENQDHKTSQSGDGRSPISSVSCRANLTQGGIQSEKGNAKEDQFSILRSGAAKGSFSNEVNIWGGRFFYMDSPAVFRAPLPTPHPMAERPWSHSVDQLGAKLESTDSVAEPVSSTLGIGGLANKEELCGGDGIVGTPFLPSRFWFLQREIQTWKELPTRCSTLVLEAATGVGRIRRRVISEWVLMQGPAHGVVTDSAMANHIHSLTKICLRALQKEAASNLTDHQCGDLLKRSIGSPPVSEDDDSHGPKAKSGPVARCETDEQKRVQHEFDTKGGLSKVEDEPPTSAVVGGVAARSSKVSLLDCPHLFRSGQWLASQLSSLFGPLQSKALVLKLLKYCLVLSGRILASSFVTAFTNQQQEATEGGLQLCRSFRNEEREGKPSEELQTLEDSKHLKPKGGKTVEDRSSTLLSEVETAVAAVRERAIFESYLRSLNYPSVASKIQMFNEHEATVAMAETERQKRVNYRPVLEHDGLIWNRSQLEEKNKNKTREEILAEERDYKRRRMSYRGKKLKRNPTEVLHDLIGGHMEEIVEAGGIGCSVKHNTGGALPQAEAGVVDSSSQPGRQDDRANEQIRSSRAFKQDSNYWTGTGSQGNRYSETEYGGTRDEESSWYKSEGSSRGKLHRHSSHHRSDSVKDIQDFHSRSGPGRDDGTDSRSDWTDNRKSHNENDRRRDRSRSQSQRYSGSREGSNEDDVYEGRHSREYRGKSKSSY